MSSLSVEAEQVMIAAAAAGHPLEVCGVVIDGVPVPVPNLSPDPASYFVMDMAYVRALYVEHGRIDGVWHSHPGGSATPSTADLAAHPRGIPMFIVAVGEVHEHAVD